MTMKLYYAPGTCSMAPHIVLHMAGVPFETQRVLLAKGEQHTPEYRAINPHGRVPVLDLGDGVRLTESAVILLYLCERFPETGLMPRGALARLRALEMNGYLASTLHAGSYAAFFRPERFAESEACRAEVRARGVQNVTDCWAYIEQRAQARDWADGPAPSLTDLYLFVFTRWARSLNIDLSGHKAVSEIVARVMALPATAATLKAEGF